jgi:DNA-binding CsgD family transcriptional regulator
MRRLLTDRNTTWFSIAVLLCNLIFLIADLRDDLTEGLPLTHMLPEVATVLLTALLVGLLLSSLHRARLESRALRARIGELELESESWKQNTARYTTGLSVAIHQEMEKWGLSTAEKDVTLLLLKGLSAKEIARLRETSEQTVKQQASAVYRKSGLTSRSELSAYFLEDLLAPSTLVDDRTSVR